MRISALKPDGTFSTFHSLAYKYLDRNLPETGPYYQNVFDLLEECWRVLPEEHTSRPHWKLTSPLASFLVECYEADRTVFEDATACKTFITEKQVQMISMFAQAPCVSVGGIPNLIFQYPE
jgi:hypothetical protein